MKKKKTYLVIDGKQRCTALSHFFTNKLAIKLTIRQPGQDHTFTRWVKFKDIYNNSDYAALLDTMEGKKITMVVYDNLSMKDQESIFRMLNNGTGLSVEEKLYCPNYLARRLLDHCYDHIFHNLGSVFQKSVRDKKRFKHIKVVHELFILSSGSQFNADPRPRVLGSKGLALSAQWLHERLRDMPFSFDAENIDLGSMKLTDGFADMVEEMKTIADRFLPVFTHADAGPPFNAKGGVVPRNVIDAIAFVHYVILRKVMTLHDFLTYPDAELIRWLGKFYESKVAGQYNMATNDIDTMTSKYKLLAEHFFQEVAQSPIPADVAADLASWEKITSRKG